MIKQNTTARIPQTIQFFYFTQNNNLLVYSVLTHRIVEQYISILAMKCSVLSLSTPMQAFNKLACAQCFVNH